MKLSKRSLSMIVAIILCATMAIGGTLAYLTDTDSKVNTFTVGDVDIQLNEEFQQGVALVPGVDIEKEVTVSNVGKNDAWVWVTVAIPAPLDTVDNASANVVHVNPLKQYVFDDSKDDAEGNWRGDWIFCPAVFNGATSQKVEIEDQVYNMYAFLRREPLKVGATSQPAISKVYLDKHVDYDPTTKTWQWVEKGKPTKINYDLSNTKLYVNAFAIQTDGFNTVEEAYDAYMGQWTENNLYTEEMLTLSTVSVDGQSELDKELDEIKPGVPTNVVLDKGTYTLPSLTNKDVTFTGTKDTVIAMDKAVTMSGSNVTFEGVTVEFPATNYIGLQHSDKIVYKNATIKGMQTLYGNEAEFINCTFEAKGEAYAVWTYGVDTTFTNCTFNTDGRAIYVYNEGVHDSEIKLIDCTFNDSTNGAVKKGAVETGVNGNNIPTIKLEFKNCTANGFAANSDNYITNSNLWGNKHNIDKDHLNVIIDGEVVY